MTSVVKLYDVIHTSDKDLKETSCLTFGDSDERIHSPAGRAARAKAGVSALTC